MVGTGYKEDQGRQPSHYGAHHRQQQITKKKKKMITNFDKRCLESE